MCGRVCRGVGGKAVTEDQPREVSLMLFLLGWGLLLDLWRLFTLFFVEAPT